MKKIKANDTTINELLTGVRRYDASAQRELYERLVLKMYNTEIKLAQLNAQQRTADSSDVLTNMFLLNESLKLLNPPQPRTTTCQARPFGVYMNIYCN